MRIQDRVKKWVLAAFGTETAYDKEERAWRFIEEAIELVQASGMSKEDVTKLLDYVYDRPVGEVRQEVGGVINTLSAFCNSYDIDMIEAAHDEIDRCWEKIEKIRAKQATKPKNSPLPGKSV